MNLKEHTLLAFEASDRMVLPQDLQAVNTIIKEVKAPAAWKFHGAERCIEVVLFSTGSKELDLRNTRILRYLMMLYLMKSGLVNHEKVH